MATYIGSTEISNGYIGIPNPESIVLDKSFISMDTVGQTSQITATIEPTLSDKTVTWTSDDTTVATVSTTGLVTCVTPGSCTITATTVNGLTATCGVGTSRLPAGYQEVEWIGSSGTQYINTGFTINQSSKIVFELSDWTQNGSYTFFGTDNGWENSGFSIVTRWAAFGSQSISDSSPWFGDGNRHTGEFSQAGLYVDNVLKGTFVTQTFTSNNLYIFGLNRAGSTQERVTGKLYSFELYDSGILVRNMIPCYTTANTEIGLYDIVNNTFYTNQGGGTFTKGPDV